jgi:hypothetical protein
MTTFPFVAHVDIAVSLDDPFEWIAPIDHRPELS